MSVGLMYRREFEWELGETITKTYEDGDLNTDRDQDHLELTMPAMCGIGVEYEASPELIVVLELQSRPFSELRWSTDIEDQPIIDHGFNSDVGAEYLGSVYPVRLGVFRNVIPFVDENDTASQGHYRSDCRNRLWGRQKLLLGCFGSLQIDGIKSPLMKDISTRKTSFALVFPQLTTLIQILACLL